MSVGGSGIDERGVVHRQGVLDLSRFTSAEELAAIRRIERVGTVVVPEPLAAAFAAIPAERVGSTVYVPAGANVRVQTGMLTVGGDGLGGPDDVLVVIGMLIITSPVTGPLPRQISVIGSVLAPAGASAALSPALTAGVGSVSSYRYVEGQDVKVLTGQVRLSAAMLANRAGGPDDVLVAAGQVVVSGPVSTVGYAQVVVAGQLAAPESARDELEPRMQVHGQVVWYQSEQPRVFFDDATVGPDFFRLLNRPTSLVPIGDLTITAGTTESVVLEKVTDLTGFGDVVAPAELVPVLQVLATDMFGTIRTADGPGS